jgi:hypothetical protein
MRRVLWIVQLLLIAGGATCGSKSSPVAPSASNQTTPSLSPAVVSSVLPLDTARTLACRYATAARWIFDHVHAGGNAALFAAQGTSGGASQIAFALAYYGIGSLLKLANLGGGPPGCPLCSPDGQHGPEPLLPAAPPAVNRDPLLSYPDTAVHFFLGQNEPTPDIVADANAYYNAITSGNKSFMTVANLRTTSRPRRTALMPTFSR